MKKLFIGLLFVLISGLAQSQFLKGELQATGLTCAMCNNAINKALLKLPYVATVRSDIKNSSFHIVFKENAETDIDGLRKAVEDAGFSIGSLKLTANFNEMAIGKDKHVMLGSNVVHFIDAPAEVLNGERTIQVVDKGFLTAKQFKKMSAKTTMPCLLTGKTAACCIKDGVNTEARVYHVTI